ncbi:hypothetical protein MSAR_35960 [Mycolicibacterium sarraceniae]|uniref:Peptidase n=1 Tax=Mycolicibacterium sarraceniae TaxID=1534348 RepID=A0A7I7SV30_9MYCO|nr:hypothetical protein MSAR_35960 [Mycolicibacterium sarraceniae]
MLVTELLVGSALIATASVPPGAPPAPAVAVPTPAPLVVGDGRIVRLISLGGAGTDGLLTRIASATGDAVGAVERFWGTDWDHEIVVIAADSQAQFVAEAGLAPSGNWADIAAVSVADGVDFAHHHATGQRMVFAPGAAGMSAGSLRIVLTHELFHFAARADTALDAPRWLVEGVADFVARPPEPLPPDAAANTALPVDADLDVAGPQRERGYDRAWWFARFVADSYGVDALRRLYGQACGPGHGDFATAVQRALGADTAALRARWAQWLTR